MQLTRLVDILKALGHPTRLHMVTLLRQNGVLKAGELKIMTKSKQSLASQQLTILRRSGAVTSRRESNCVYYRLVHDLIPLIDTVIALREG